MSKQFKIAFLVCVGIAFLIALITLIESSTYGWANAGVWMFLISVIYFFVGLICLIPAQIRPTGQAMLASSLILLIIGFSICSNTSFHI
jgi:hypothetical protein